MHCHTLHHHIPHTPHHPPQQANQVLLEQLGSSAQHLAVNRQAVSGLAAKETDDLPTSPEYDSLGRPVHILREYGGEEGDLGTSPVRYYPPIKSPVYVSTFLPLSVLPFLAPHPNPLSFALSA